MTPDLVPTTAAFQHTTYSDVAFSHYEDWRPSLRDPLRFVRFFTIVFP